MNRRRFTVEVGNSSKVKPGFSMSQSAKPKKVNSDFSPRLGMKIRQFDRYVGLENDNRESKTDSNRLS